MKAAISHTTSIPSQGAVAFTPNNCPIYLQADQRMRLRAAVGWTVRALNGSVWITQDGDIRDIVLQGGESFVVDRQGPVLVSPMLSPLSPSGGAEVRLEHASLRLAAPCGAARPTPATALREIAPRYA